MSREIKRIAVFTSGGDAPGMNSAVRAVVRTASFHDLHVYGIRRGYEGMIDCDIRRLEKRDVGNILQRGGTVLKTARSERFRTPEGRKSAYESLLAHDIDACIAIGGDGTFTGASIFSQEYDIPFIGIPGTIDNDIYGTDHTIGFDTAVNTAMEAVDKIRDTAESHNRLFFVEVMGRHAGFIALNVGISGGAEMVLLPETDTPLESIVERLRKSAKRKKMFSLVLVAEGNKSGRAREIAAQVEEELDMFDIRTTVVGHLQRGGSPSGFDRVLSSRLGFHAVEGLLNGKENVAVGIVNDKIRYTAFEDAINKSKNLNKDLVRMAEILGQ
jgi:6-phosphofructokinase 1